MDNKEVNKPEQILWLEKELGLEMFEVKSKELFFHSDLHRYNVYLTDSNREIIGLRIRDCHVRENSCIAKLDKLLYSIEIGFRKLDVKIRC